MIISASRRTDIPSYYSDWFFNRIQEGFVLARNPMNFHQVSKISLSPDVVDGIVFWTKNPAPMIPRLCELQEYMYYFQFTLTSYGKGIETNLPSKNDNLLTSFKRLSEAIGPERVIWRYDPIFINGKYSFEYHLRAFEKIAKELQDYTQKVTISFIDTNYRGVKGNIKDLALLDFPKDIKLDLGSNLANIAHKFGLTIDTCAEDIDLKQFGIGQARCIDERLLGKLLGCDLILDKDRNQRLECGCVASVDIGMYNTCRNGCRYCYANYSKGSVDGNFSRHDLQSPLLSGNVGEDDKITERKLKSSRNAQIQLFGA